MPLLGAAHASCSPRGYKASEYVVFDADEEWAWRELQLRRLRLYSIFEYTLAW